MSNNDFPKAPINRIFKKAGGQRLSEDARDLILENIEAYAMDLMRDSIYISRHVGRKTVLPADVKLAKKLM